ncbi:hypothetical protein BDV93DRAFT_556983 [Ceratobasidium sp. AG-I]|nr:hypothetical protein BDV93DRAFT_556983 [Ceratobasidium sp. AG-I]
MDSAPRALDVEVVLSTLVDVELDLGPRSSSSTDDSAYSSEPLDEEGDDVPLLSPMLYAPRIWWWNAQRKWVAGVLSQFRGPRLPERLSQCSWLEHPWVPSHLSSLIFTFLLFVIFVLLTKSFITYLLNPDKYQLPWRSFCTLTPSFPPSSPALSSLPPVGLFIGVMSTAASYERRQLIRSTWASHPLSRGSERGTERTVVRFVVGMEDGSVRRRVELENELYGDIIILPIEENMNDGKTYAYFSWAYKQALVPPLFTNDTASHVSSYHTLRVRHDPASGALSDWVKPDFVVKADEDSFVMLAELEARLRIELHRAREEAKQEWDPLVYWGYLVKERFMAGELYALSWPLVEYAATSSVVRSLTVGAEDKQVAKWMRAHPQASRVRWASEQCWIYNHPKSGTVYAHGFLFPSETHRIKETIAPGRTQDEIEHMGLPTSYRVDWPKFSWSSVTGPVPWYAYERVERLTDGMGVEALIEGSPLSWELSARQRPRHALPSSSAYPMSGLNSSSVDLERKTRQERIQAAYDRRETRVERYMGKDLGGTIVVHYLKRDEWFLETSLAFLGE